MERLYTPDLGMMVWTVLTFLIVVGVLARYAWKPLLGLLDERDAKLAADAQAAAAARAAAEKLKTDFERQMSDFNTRTQTLWAEAQQEAAKSREDILKAAQQEAARLAERTRQQLSEEQRRLIQELRADTVALAVRGAEKILEKNLDKSAQERFVQESLADFEKSAKP